MDLSQAFTAFTWGGVSAVSLPLGALLGLWLRPGKKWTSSLMSFGAGALLAALTLELVAKSLHHAGFWPLGTGCLAGALLFMFLNSMLNGQGGFLRKLSTTVRHLTDQKRKRAESMIERFGRVALLRALPPEEMQALVPELRQVRLPSGDTVFTKGDAGDKLYLIESGEVEVRQGATGQSKKIARLQAGDSFGEMALLTGDARTATVRVTQDLAAWTLEKADFDRLLKDSPALKASVTKLTESRKVELELLAAATAQEESRTWSRIAKAHLTQDAFSVGHADIKSAHAEHGGGAALAIWLGILLDGIPESLVIGATLIGNDAMSLTLIVGVFLANLPEALSSAVGMKNQGYSFGKVIWMWVSLMLMTAVGAFIGNITFGSLSPGLFALVEGVAAGAMLAMIAETMLPEAAEQGGPANGLMTVLGFLAAIFVSTLGHH